MDELITKKQIKQIEKFASKFYKKLDYAHNWSHAKRTVKLAEYIAKKENADVQICKISALLHQFHNKKKVEKFLRKIKLDKNLGRQIVHCVECCSTYNIHKAKTLEAKVVYDSDHLQILGVLGIYRLFSLVPFEKLSQKTIRDIYNLQKDRVKYIQTETGKRLTKDLHIGGTTFFREFKKWDKAIL